MDAALLTSASFWSDPEPMVPGGLPAALPGDDRLLGSVIFQTSGSSGTPKWVVISKKALLASAEAVNSHLQVDQKSCWGLALPLHHVGGFGVAARAYKADCALEEFGQRWDAAAFGAWIAARPVTHLSLVPTQVHDLVKAGVAAPVHVKAVVVGGGHLAKAAGQAARDLGWPVLASYGMTEAGSQIATQGFADLQLPYRPAPIPLLGTWRAEISSTGLLTISGAALFSGFISPDLTSGDLSYNPRVSERYITSDRVSLGPGGITPLGRADSLVKVLGELVDPETIEYELVQISSGKLLPAEVSVIAIADERAGHRLVPVFEQTVAQSIIQDVLDVYHKLAPGFRRLEVPVVVSEIPRSSLGKVLREDLRRKLLP
jgi:o-succinylbenzoate---CoA ligase